MGLHGNATCTLTLGGRGKCVGTLLGQENKGMRAMFLMMNEARQLVGLQGFAAATASYIYAVNYARQRIQGKHLTAGKAADAPSVPIIQHPDVRRQLLTMKAYVEGMRSLIYYGGLTHDLEGLAQSDGEKEKYADRTAILTPIIKGYITDRALEVTSHGIQVYGGYGYIQEYPMEQLMRDCRIFQIYEGTNGIQAMDLLGRKLGMKKGQPFMDYLGEMEKTIAEAGKISVLDEVTRRVETAVNRLSEVAVSLAKASVSDNALNAYAYAHPFLDVTGDVSFAWMHLWRAVLAARKLEKLAGAADMEKFMEKAAKNKDAAFYVGSLKTAEFFATNILPGTMGKLDAIADVNGAAVEMPDASFGG
jgi:hypothetical protein